MRKLRLLADFLAIALAGGCVCLAYIARKQFIELAALRDFQQTTLRHEAVERAEAAQRAQAAKAAAAQAAAARAVAKVDPANAPSSASPSYQSVVDDPRLVGLMTARDRAYILSKYGAIISRLGLSEDMAEKLMSLIEDRRKIASDLSTSAALNNPDLLTDPELFQAQVREEQNQINAQIAALLGQDAYTQFQQYEQSDISAQLVQRVQGLLAGTGNELTPDQQAQLQQTISNLNARSVANRVINAAQSYLSDSQIAALQVIHQQQVQANQLRIQGAAPAGP